METVSSIVTRSSAQRNREALKVKKVLKTKPPAPSPYRTRSSGSVSPTSKATPKVRPTITNKQKARVSTLTIKIQPSAKKHRAHTRLMSPYIWMSRLNQLSQQLSCPTPAPANRSSPAPSAADIPSRQLALFREAQTRARDKLKLKCAPAEVSCLPFSSSDKHISEGPLPEAVLYGRYNLKPSFPSPYPALFSSLHQLFLCPKCFQYFSSSATLSLHMFHCICPSPPGTEIYRKGSLSFFEVDGDLHKRFCQNLCLLSKLFLDHKTIFRDVGPFLFYLLYQWVSDAGVGDQWEFIGYFSKEKLSDRERNLSCIMVLPQHLRRGYGNLLIDFSYLLSRREEKQGSPERPLSDLGLLAYRSYWRSVILEYARSLMASSEEEEDKRTPVFSVKNLSLSSGVRPEDLVSTLQYYGLIKYWKGSHVILLDECKGESAKKCKLDPNLLVWEPTEWYCDSSHV